MGPGKEQDFLKTHARTRPLLEIRIAGEHLRDFELLRPCRGEDRTVTDRDNS